MLPGHRDSSRCWCKWPILLKHQQQLFVVSCWFNMVQLQEVILQMVEQNWTPPNLNVHRSCLPFNDSLMSEILSTWGRERQTYFHHHSKPKNICCTFNDPADPAVSLRLHGFQDSKIAAGESCEGYPIGFWQVNNGKSTVYCRFSHSINHLLWCLETGQPPKVILQISQNLCWMSPGGRDMAATML